MQIATFTSRRCTEMGDVELRFYEILIREEIENLCENGRFLQGLLLSLHLPRRCSLEIG